MLSEPHLISVVVVEPRIRDGFVDIANLSMTLVSCSLVSSGGGVLKDGFFNARRPRGEKYIMVMLMEGCVHGFGGLGELLVHHCM